MNLNKSSHAEKALMRILVVGSGGRENALGWALQKSNGVEHVFITPGNGGTKDLVRCTCLDISESNFIAIKEFCLHQKINLVVIGPEAPLAGGLADELRDSGIIVFGPGKDGAQLEASKIWSKKLLVDSKIPTANYWEAVSEKDALSILKQVNTPLVVKADGLAAGKGVTVATSIEETVTAIKDSFQGKFGSSGTKIVLEECMQGPEVSVFAICDGKDYILLPTAQDHKRLKDGDIGPNTGGMGAYSPAKLTTQTDIDEISEKIIEPTIKALRRRGIDYRGVIYAGLMITSKGPKVIEFNCRFGDPECQAIMPLMGPEFAYILQACATGSISSAPELTIAKSYSACVVAAAHGYPDSTRSGDIVDIQLKPNDYIQIFHAGTKSNENGKITTSGGRVLSVVSQGENFDEAFTNVYNGIKQIHFDGMVYRLDIGHQVRTI